MKFGENAVIVLRNYLRWGALLLLTLLVLTLEATFAVNETGSNEKINAPRSANITNATTNIATLRNLTITTNVSKIKNLTVSIDLPMFKIKTARITNTTTAVAAMPVNPTNAIANGTKPQNNSGGGCPCNSQG
jgi:hypothetical protein